MKILIAADMEGITGVVNWNQVDPEHAEYTRFRRLMTADVNAAIHGAYEAGANEVIVVDGHALGYNLLIEELDPRARLNAGNSYPLEMLQGLGKDVNGVIFIGYHARAGTQNAILDHTWSSSRIANVRLNNVPVGEVGLNAAVCGHYNVPVIMVTGDQAVCAEATELLGQIETAVVKHATGRNSAECLSPQVTQERIQETTKQAVHRLRGGDIPEPFRLQIPVQITIGFINSEYADQALRMPGAQRLDGRSITFSADDALTAYMSFQATVSLARG
jgi:D-amino peptidase